MREIELKACPFCGAKPEAGPWQKQGLTVQCRSSLTDCPVCPGYSHYEPEGAVATWNTRAPQWQPIESLVSDELVITWHDFGGINQNTASPHYGKKGYSRIQQRFGGRLFPSEACETGFVSHWQPLPAAPEVPDGRS